MAKDAELAWSVSDTAIAEVSQEGVITPKKAGIITVTVRLLPGRVVYVRIADRGCGIADIGQAMTPLYSGAPAEERAGLGFTVMQSFTDSLAVRSRVGIGTVITMRKRLNSADENTAGRS